jgi:tRNA threonylcarbamoyl adenosine modification protein (Sua5/YciO/YrdC/YwlC family)
MFLLNNYSVACNANDSRAIQNLYEIKGRDENKPVAICVSEIDDLRRWGKASHLPDSLLARLLPGPVTIVFKKTRNLKNPYLNPGTDKIGIRIPDFDFIRNICKKFKEPIALTSANRSSEPSSLTVDEFIHLWPQLGGVFDGGSLGVQETQRTGSSVIDLSKRNVYKIIRSGIAIDATLETLHEYGIEADS